MTRRPVVQISLTRKEQAYLDELKDMMRMKRAAAAREVLIAALQRCPTPEQMRRLLVDGVSEPVARDAGQDEELARRLASLEEAIRGLEARYDRAEEAAAALSAAAARLASLGDGLEAAVSAVRASQMAAPASAPLRTVPLGVSGPKAAALPAAAPGATRPPVARKPGIPSGPPFRPLSGPVPPVARARGFRELLGRRWHGMATRLIRRLQQIR